MQLRKGLQAANPAPSKGGYQQQQPEFEEPDERTLCPHCGRKFNENAAQRHITFCANKHKQAAMKSGPMRRR